MAIQTKDDAQGKADRRLDRNMKKVSKIIPIEECKFVELVTLADQLKWIEIKRKQKQKS